jgi:CHAT domain-containing protein
MRSGPAIPTAAAGQSQLVRRIREMREELNWYYRRIELEQLSAEEPSPERIGKLQEQALAHENDLLHVLREVPQSGEIASQPPLMSSLDSIRASLPADAALVEYFSLKDQFIAAVVTRERLEIVPITPVSRVVNLMRMLQFQISKFRLGAEYVRTFEKPMLEATQAHLRQLYDEVLAPVRPYLTGTHLIVVPHGVLHYAPFHAFHDGTQYAMDSFTVSYAPSAGVFAHCQQKSYESYGPALVLGVPDSRAPFIDDEVRAVAAIIPDAELIVGENANEKALRDKGANSRLIHIATHGRFRQDNPMFSGIRLGDAYLCLYDFYHLKLNAELVTLSGCATGMNVVTAGDELLGLIRGLLYAGAQSVLLSLWDVHDRSTAKLMDAFYRRYCDGTSNAAALRSAMVELRETRPHPYYWAAFALTGKIPPA